MLASSPLVAGALRMLPPLELAVTLKCDENVLLPLMVSALVLSTLLFRVVERSVLFSDIEGTARECGMETAPVEVIDKAWRL